MHTYKKSGSKWNVIFKTSSNETVISTYNTEDEAAARVNYLNGGSQQASGTPSGIKVLATS